MDMEIVLTGGMKVEAKYKDFTIKTDQPVRDGGEGSAPAPMDLFLASIGTCAGYYVLSFCAQRNIPTAGIRVIQKMEKNAETHLFGKISIEIQLPADFPEKYRGAVIKAADLCTVKRHMTTPPQFEVYATTV